MLKIGSNVVISKGTGLPLLFGKKGKIKTCRYKDITKNMDVSWQVELDKPLEMNGVVIREVWLPQEALMETVPTTETKDTWENLMG